MITLIQKSCTECHGSGEMRKKTVCSHCFGKTCCHCESHGSVTLYKTCDMCCGYGMVFFEKNTSKQHFLFAIKNYCVENIKNNNEIIIQ